jgi:outer membrane biosynthesis protein TonB
MPEQLSRATVAACAVLAAVVFGGAYALAHGSPAKPAPAPAQPAALRLADQPVGALHRVSPLPALKVPPPRPKPAQPQQPVVTVPTPVVSAPAPTPTPAPTPQPAPAPKPRPHAPAKKPLTFDNSG